MRRIPISCLAAGFLALAAFLGYASLEPGTANGNPNQGCVSVGTVRAEHAPVQADEHLSDVLFRLCPV
jgi:hypothetical protein